MAYANPAKGALREGGPGNFAPVDHNYLAWTGDPTLYAGAATAIGLNEIHLLKVVPRITSTITAVVIVISTAGTTLVAAQNWLGLYDQAGTRLGQTADATTDFGATGIKTLPLTTPAVAQGAQPLYIAILANGATAPTLTRGASNAGVNAGLVAPNCRVSKIATAATVLPASLTMASQTGVGNAWWAALA